MRIHDSSISSTTVFRLAQAVLPEPLMLALFGRPVPVAVERTQVRRMVARRRFRR
jgi:hypothetical protein